MSGSKATRLGELSAYDLGSTITFRDGGATYKGSLLAVKHEFPDNRRKTFVMIASSSGKWRHSDRYPSNLPIDEIVAPALASGGVVPAGTPVVGSRDAVVVVATGPDQALAAAHVALRTAAGRA